MLGEIPLANDDQHYHTMIGTTSSLHVESNIQPQTFSNKQLNSPEEKIINKEKVKQWDILARGLGASGYKKNLLTGGLWR